MVLGICQECGFTLPDGASNCPECGIQYVKKRTLRARVLHFVLVLILALVLCILPVFIFVNVPTLFYWEAYRENQEIGAIVKELAPLIEAELTGFSERYNVSIARFHLRMAGAGSRFIRGYDISREHPAPLVGDIWGQNAGGPEAWAKQGLAEKVELLCAGLELASCVGFFATGADRMPLVLFGGIVVGLACTVLALKMQKKRDARAVCLALLLSLAVITSMSAVVALIHAEEIDSKYQSARYMVLEYRVPDGYDYDSLKAELESMLHNHPLGMSGAPSRND